MGKRQVKFPYLKEYVDCRGKPRAYLARPNEKEIPLPVPVGSPEFMRAYTEALEGKQNKTTAQKAAQPRDTFNNLIKLYFASSRFSQLSTSTKKNYRAVLEKFASKYGKLPVSQFSRRHAEMLLSKSSDRPEAANNLLNRSLK